MLNYSNKSHTLKIFTFLTLLVALSVFTGCGAGSSGAVSTADSSASGAYMTGSTKVSAALDTYVTEEAAYADTGAAESESLIGTDRKLVKTYYISLESTSFDETVELITSRAEALGGYIESSSVSGTTIRYADAGTRSAYIVARIPTGRVDEYLSEAEASGNVLRRSEEIEDITLRYTDTESYLEALNLEQSRLMELIGEAESVEDLIALNSRLTEVERLIESNARELRLYDNQIDYTSISFDISEVKIYSPAAEEGILSRMKRGLNDNIEGIKNGAVDALVWFVSHLPGIILAILIIAVVFMIARKSGITGRIGNIYKKRGRAGLSDKETGESPSKAEDK